MSKKITPLSKIDKILICIIALGFWLLLVGHMIGI